MDEQQDAGKVPDKSRNPNLKGGSRKGVPNKASKELKDMILKALDGAGGVEYLQERAKDPRTASAFLTLVGKVLPMTVQGPGADGAHVFTVIERRIVRPGP
jgi:hypothetical protein